MEISWWLSGHGKMSDGAERVVDRAPIHLLAIEGIGRRKIVCVAVNSFPQLFDGLASFFRWENNLAIKFLHQFAGATEIAGAAAIFRDSPPGELQPIGMLVDRSDKHVDVTAAVPKLKKLAFFFRLHRDQVRIGIEKLAEGGLKFFGVQLRKIDEGQIMFTESKLPDNLARRRIA